MSVNLPLEKSFPNCTAESGSSKGLISKFASVILSVALFNMLLPKVFISYERLAFFGKDDSDFRLTLDRNILSRREDLFLDSPVYGKALLKEGQWLMEAKAFKTFPLWFAHFLSQRKIYKSSFSKYGAEYASYKGEQLV